MDLDLDLKYMEDLFMGGQYILLKYHLLIPKYGKRELDMSFGPMNLLLINLTTIRIEVVGKKNFCPTDVAEWICDIFVDTSLSREYLTNHLKTLWRKVQDLLEAGTQLAVDELEELVEDFYVPDYDTFDQTELEDLLLYREMLFAPLSCNNHTNHDVGQFMNLRNCCYALC